MDPKRVFETKQTELELDDASDAGLIEVLYKLNNPSTADSIIQPTLKKSYLPSFREQMAKRWARFQTDTAYRRMVVIGGSVCLLLAILLVRALAAAMYSGPLPLTPERLVQIQDNARALQDMAENFAVDTGGYPTSINDLAKFGGQREYNALRTDPLTATTGTAVSQAWCRDGAPAGGKDWIGKVGYVPTANGDRVVGYKIMLGGDDGFAVTANGQPMALIQRSRAQVPTESGG